MKLVTSVFALTGVVALGALALPQARTRGTTAVVATRTSQVQLPAAGGSRVPATAALLDPGAWTLVGKVSAVNFGPADYVRCELRANGAKLDGATAHVGTSNFVATIVTLGGIRVDRAAQVVMECWHDVDRRGLYLDPGATILATPADAVDVAATP